MLCEAHLTLWSLDHQSNKTMAMSSRCDVIHINSDAECRVSV